MNDTSEPKSNDEDCLHCEIWATIHRFCKKHPNGTVKEDVLLPLATVIGDQLRSKGSQPYQEEFIAYINQMIRKRIAKAPHHD